MVYVRKGLNPKQKMFVEEYLIDFNALGAAIRAGYSPKTAYSNGSRLLKDAEVMKALAKAQEKRSEKTGITAEYVLTSLKSVAERCQQAEPVLDKKGNPTGEWQFRETGANKALELLGKNLKLFTDKLDINVTLVGAWEKASDEEKLELLGKIKDDLGIEE
jgi:phage terminase small subunit